MGHGWQHLLPDDRARILQGLRHGGAAFGGPFHLEFDWTDRCNVHCFFCHNDVRNATQRDLDPEIVRQTLEYARRRGLRSIRLSGGGDPLFHRRIHDLLDIVRESGVRIDNVTTNGVLLTEAIVEKLLAIGTDQIIVSLNYADAGTYGRLMETNPKNFERALDGIRRVKAMPLPVGKERPQVVVQFILHAPTCHQVPAMLALAESVGADLILYRDLYNVPAGQRIPESERPRVAEDLRQLLRAENGRGRIHLELSEERLNHIAAEVEAERRRARGEAEPPPAAPPENTYCYMPWYSAAVRGNGDVFACCMLMIEPDARPLGNVNEHTFENIWNGPGYETIRREMERVMLLRTRLDPRRHGFKYIFPVCTKHAACPLAHALADAPFYGEAEDIHEAKRRTLGGIMTRVRSSRLFTKAPPIATG